MTFQVWTLPAKPEPELPWLEFELPSPPSVNRFMAKLGNRSPIVQKWIDQADKEVQLEWSKRGRKFTTHKCLCEAEYLFGKNLGDLSNRVKALEDYLQRIGIIENDKLIEQYFTARRWAVVPPKRVKVRIRPYMTTEGK